MVWQPNLIDPAWFQPLVPSPSLLAVPSLSQPQRRSRLLPFSSPPRNKPSPRPTHNENVSSCDLPSDTSDVFPPDMRAPPSHASTKFRLFMNNLQAMATIIDRSCTEAQDLEAICHSASLMPIDLHTCVRELTDQVTILANCLHATTVNRDELAR